MEIILLDLAVIALSINCFILTKRIDQFQLGIKELKDYIRYERHVKMMYRFRESAVERKNKLAMGEDNEQKQNVGELARTTSNGYQRGENASADGEADRASEVGNGCASAKGNAED